MEQFKIRLLTAREIECRVSQVGRNGDGVSLLLYKDARCDMAILDETFGPMNWQRHHSRDNANCIVSVWDEGKQQWIDKEDVGTESNTEAIKGLASDSFKRACVNIGIGRELYTAPYIWINAANCNIYQEGGKLRCKDRFEVNDIGYNEHREINRLVIVNARTKSMVFEYGTGKSNSKSQGDPLDDVEIKSPTCERCHKVITGKVLSDGTTFTAPELIANSKLKYFGVYCWDCMQALKKLRKEHANVGN